jgi:hypothetical protein
MNAEFWLESLLEIIELEDREGDGRWTEVAEDRVPLQALVF